MLPRHKGTKKFIQVVPSLRGLRTRAIPANVFDGSSNRRPRSQRPPLTRTSVVVQRYFLITTKLLISNPIPAKEIHEDSCRNSGQSETPQNDSSRRLTGHPRKA